MVHEYMVFNFHTKKVKDVVDFVVNFNEFTSDSFCTLKIIMEKDKDSEFKQVWMLMDQTGGIQYLFIHKDDSHTWGSGLKAAEWGNDMYPVVFAYGVYGKKLRNDEISNYK